MFLINTTAPWEICTTTRQACVIFTSYLTWLTSKLSAQKGLNKSVGASTQKQVSQQNHINMNNSTPVLILHWVVISAFSAGNANVPSFGLAYLPAGGQLRHGERPLIPCCFSGDREQNVWTVYPCIGVVPEPSPEHWSNATARAFHVLRQANQCTSTQALIYSPDNGVNNMGWSQAVKTDKEYTIQLNVPQAHVQKFLFSNKFMETLWSDPDLISLKRDKLANIFQILFVSTGCDYNFYSKSLGKATFLNVLYHHFHFITGEQMAGCIQK